jgi:hypothetical protein
VGYIRLNPKDAEKYGVAEEIRFDLVDVGRKQVRAFEAETKRSYRWLIDQLRGVPELDAAGNPIPVPVIDDETGEPVYEDDGVTPKLEPKTYVPAEAVDMFAYLILWGNGVRVPWDEFDLREVGFLLSFLDPDEQPGKDDEPTTDSASTPST